MALPAAAAAAYQTSPAWDRPRLHRASRPPSCRAPASRISCPARSRIPSSPSARANRPPPPQVSGKANIVDVVNSVNAAELTLDTVVAVRDKVVAAYQSIMNMPI